MSISFYNYAFYLIITDIY